MSTSVNQPLNLNLTAAYQPTTLQYEYLFPFQYTQLSSFLLNRTKPFFCKHEARSVFRVVEGGAKLPTLATFLYGAGLVEDQSLTSIPNFGHSSPKRDHDAHWRWKRSTANVLNGFLLLRFESAEWPNWSSTVSFVDGNVSPSRKMWDHNDSTDQECWSQCRQSS